MLEVLRTLFGTASLTGLASPTRCSSHLHHIAFDDDRPVFEQPVRSALHDNLDRDAIYGCDALIESNTTVPGLRHESQVPVLCGARQLGPNAPLRLSRLPAFPSVRCCFPYTNGFLQLVIIIIRILKLLLGARPDLRITQEVSSPQLVRDPI